jgi:hypothetical protein
VANDSVVLDCLIQRPECVSFVLRRLQGCGWQIHRRGRDDRSCRICHGRTDACFDFRWPDGTESFMVVAPQKPGNEMSDTSEQELRNEQRTWIRGISDQRQKESGVTDPREEINDWFIKYGVPHFCVHLRDRKGLLEQAAPALVTFFPLQVLAGAVVTGAWLASLVELVAVPFTLAALRARRRYGRLWPRSWAWALALAGILLLTGLAAVLADGATLSGAVWAASLALGLDGAILIWKVLALGSVLAWVACRIWHELKHIGYLAGRGLPMLVIFTVLTLFSSDLWHVAYGMGDGRLLGALAACVLLGLFFLGMRLPEEINRSLKTEESNFQSYKRFGADEICRGWEAAMNTQSGLRPLEELFGKPVDELKKFLTDDPHLGREQTTNMFFYLLFCQMIQVGIMTSIVWLFFLGFGWLAVTDSVVAEWFSGTKVTYPYSLHLLGVRVPVVSNQLLDVSALLAIFAGVFFAVSAIADSDYREEFFKRTIDDLRHAVSVRCAYLTLLSNHEPIPPTADGGVPVSQVGPDGSPQGAEVLALAGSSARHPS